MDTLEKITQYYDKEHPFKEGIAILRGLAKRTEAQENFKWNFPVYTLKNKNVFGICKFKNHFGVWFFNGVFLSDPKNVLQNAQEGKTKGMRHWKFPSISEIDEIAVLAYMEEALENQRQGLEIKVAKKGGAPVLPDLLKQQLNESPELKKAFEQFSEYKKKEFCEYITEAKRETTKKKRMEKIVPLIKSGIGLNDAYRKKST